MVTWECSSLRENFGGSHRQPETVAQALLCASTDTDVCIYIYIFVLLEFFYTFLCRMYIIMHLWKQRRFQNCRSSSHAPFQAPSQQKQLSQLTGSPQHTPSCFHLEEPLGRLNNLGTNQQYCQEIWHHSRNPSVLSFPRGTLLSLLLIPSRAQHAMKQYSLIKCIRRWI